MKRLRLSMKLRLLAATAGVGVAGLAAAPSVMESASLYKLPYPGGTTYLVTQGSKTGGHVGVQDYSWDFGMPVGTNLAAVRSGTVKYVREDSNVCGCSSAYGNSANYVVVDHGDGTQALYLHLQYNGALVSPGQRVEQGQIIAKSGMTGWTCGSAAGGCGPHLHFQVERAGIWFTQSLPISFGDVPTNGGIPLTGRSYTSDNYPSANPAPTPPPSTAGCNGTDCNGKDAAVVNCATDATTVASQNVSFGSGTQATNVLVEVRWSSTCKTNWARAQVVQAPAGAAAATLSVRLDDVSNQTLGPTAAQATAAQVYGPMWYAPTQQVQACVTITGPARGSVCTKPV